MRSVHEDNFIFSTLLSDFSIILVISGSYLVDTGSSLPILYSCLTRWTSAGLNAKWGAASTVNPLYNVGVGPVIYDVKVNLLL